MKTLSRTVVGACAGAVAGAGVALTLEVLTKYCYLKPGRTGCGVGARLMSLPLTFAVWMLVAGVLIVLGFRVTRQERWLRATVIGSALWVVLIVAVFWIRFGPLDLVQEDSHLFALVAAVVVPCVAYGFATSAAGRVRQR